jgi:hypothetical protein
LPFSTAQQRTLVGAFGSKIYSALEAHAFARGVLEIRTEASRISRPFFEKQGYAVMGIEHVSRFGLEFERFRMRKKRNGSQDASVAHL